MHQDRELLMLSLTRFFSRAEHMQAAASIIRGTADVSLRLIDWFITNYAKRNNAVATRGDAYFNIYLSYRTQLKTFSKHQFDPFRRHERIKFCFGEAESIETTVGQLNFFRWAIENGILDYIREHRGVIESAMSKQEAGGGARQLGHPAPPCSGGSMKPLASEIRHHRLKTLISFE